MKKTIISDSFFIPQKLAVKGGTPIQGSVDISGAKNSVLGLMCAALLTDEPVFLHNVPYITDVLEMGHILRELGVDVRHNIQQKILYIRALNIKSNIISRRAAHFRASYYLWGSLLARFRITGEFNNLKVLVPGGCSFGGKRPTDFHEDLIRCVFSASIEEETADGHNYLNFKLPEYQQEKFTPIYSTLKASHGATFHWLLSVAGAREVKMMYNSSMEPEISNLIEMLQQMGLGISGTERTGIIYDGKNKSLLKGGDFYVIPDRLEAATYALLAVGTQGEIQINGIRFDHCRPWFDQLNRMFNTGIFYSPDRTQLNLNFRRRPEFEGVIMQMTPFPGLETDTQQIWTPVLSQASSDSIISDMIWPGRDKHLTEMAAMGLISEHKQLNIITTQEIADKKALWARIKPSCLHKGKVNGMDLRGTMGLIIAAAIADGSSTITDPSYALRGYPHLVRNLQQLGINVSTSKEGETIENLPDYEG